MRRILTVLVISAVLVVSSVPASASCAPAPPLEESIAAADLVFVGTVIGLADDDRTARFEVEEVWKGVLDATVTVHGGPGLDAVAEARAQGQMVFTSVDRTYEMGVRYLVVPHDPSGAVPLDSACTATTVYRAEFDGLRPETVLFPEPPLIDGGATDTGGMGLVGWLAIGIAATGVIGAGTLIVTRDPDSRTDRGFTRRSGDDST